MTKNTTNQEPSIIQNSFLEKLIVIIINLSMLPVLVYWYHFIIVPGSVVHWIIFLVIILATLISIRGSIAVLRNKLDIRDYLNLSNLEKKRRKSGSKKL